MDGIVPRAGSDGYEANCLGSFFNNPPEVSGAVAGVFNGFSHVL